MGGSGGSETWAGGTNRSAELLQGVRTGGQDNVWVADGAAVCAGGGDPNFRGGVPSRVSMRRSGGNVNQAA